MKRVRAPKRSGNCPKSRVSTAHLSHLPPPSKLNKTFVRLFFYNLNEATKQRRHLPLQSCTETEDTTTRHMRDLSARALHVPRHGQCDAAHLGHLAPSFTSSPRCGVDATLSLPQARVQRVPDHTEGEEQTTAQRRRCTSHQGPCEAVLARWISDLGQDLADRSQ